MNNTRFFLSCDAPYGYSNFLDICNKSNARYWCIAEHLTPSGDSRFYGFIEYWYPVQEYFMQITFGSTFKIQIPVNRVPSDHYVEDIKTKGIPLNLGKSKLIPGTCAEKKGGFKYAGPTFSHTGRYYR